MGLVDNDSGCVGVTVHYTAILLRPFPLEVLDAVVTNAVEVMLCLQYVLLSCSISSYFNEIIPS